MYIYVAIIMFPEKGVKQKHIYTHMLLFFALLCFRKKAFCKAYMSYMLLHCSLKRPFKKDRNP